MAHKLVIKLCIVVCCTGFKLCG